MDKITKQFAVFLIIMFGLIFISSTIVLVYPSAYNLYFFNGEQSKLTSYPDIETAAKSCASLNGYFLPSENSKYGTCTGSFTIIKMEE